jgi:hypothetical protein
VGEANRLAKLAETDPEAAWRAFRALGAPPGDPEMADLRKRAGAFIAGNRVAALADTGRCREIEGAISDWVAFEPSAKPNHIRASCYEQRAMRSLKNDRVDDAVLRDLREAHRLEPADSAFIHNLVAALERAAYRSAERGECVRATPFIREGLALEPSDEVFRQTSRRCGL